jgi:predicted Ser/Thr protein kinase
LASNIQTMTGILRNGWCIMSMLLIFSACNSSKTNELLIHKKWRVYDVKVPSNEPYNSTQVNQAAELKKGYYTDVYYQFLDNNLFIATNAGQPDSGRYQLLSNGKIISITSPNGSRNAEHLLTVVKLDEDHFDMKVVSGDYHFILCTKKD